MLLHTLRNLLLPMVDFSAARPATKTIREGDYATLEDIQEKSE